MAIKCNFYHIPLYIAFLHIYFAKMSKEITLAIFAIVAALGLVGVLAIETLILPQQQQQAFAKGQPPGRGCEFTPGGNASKLRCVHP